MNKAINLSVYGNNAMSLRRNVLHHSLLAARLANYTLTHAAPAEWRLGELGHYAGWHCSWCYEPPGIRLKLQSAQVRILYASSLD